MKLVDIHTHSSNSNSENIRIRNVSLREAEEQISFGNDRFLSLGIHPWEVDAVTETEFDRLAELVQDSRVKLIGECGLDKFSKADYPLQLLYFKKQIELSEQIGKPLIIHCVGYLNELFALQKELKPVQRWIIHGFRGKPQLAEQALRAGCDLSFGEKYNPESVKITPVERLLIETDESTASLEDIYRNIAAIKGCKLDDLRAGRDLLNC